jgi:hypothetical protein
MKPQNLTLWAYEAPNKHQHRTSGWSFIDDEEHHKDTGTELVLRCSRCAATWHTGLPADDDWHDVDDLKAAAVEWLRAELLGKVTRRQLTLPLVIADAAPREIPKRVYRTLPRPDYSAQMSLFALAA